MVRCVADLVSLSRVQRLSSVTLWPFSVRTDCGKIKGAALTRYLQNCDTGMLQFRRYENSDAEMWENHRKRERESWTRKDIAGWREMETHKTALLTCLLGNPRHRSIHKNVFGTQQCCWKSSKCLRPTGPSPLFAFHSDDDDTAYSELSMIFADATRLCTCMVAGCRYSLRPRRDNHLRRFM